MNHSDSNFNKLFKLQPLIGRLRSKFKHVEEPETFMLIDEMMIAFKGRHSAKVYKPTKSTKSGYKIWCRAGISGHIYDFEVMGARSTKGPPTSMNLLTALGESEYVVLRLCETLEPAKQFFF